MGSANDLRSAAPIFTTMIEDFLLSQLV